MTEPTSRICREVQAHLPRLVDGATPRWRERLIRRHLRRCDDCGAELERQEAVADGLRELGSAADADAPAAPDDLLDAILAKAQSPGLRERAAVPARGAVSGARPALSVAFLVAAALVGTALGMAIWRAGRGVSKWLGGGPEGTGPSGSADL
jgi:predicted anti-sigma-YlaC factor YlaD